MELAMAPASMTRGSRPRRLAEMAQASPMGPAPAISVSITDDFTELPRQRRSFARFLVLEEYEGVLPPGTGVAQAPRPIRQVLGDVSLVAQAHVPEIGRGLERRVARFGVGDAQRHVARTEQLVGVGGEPRFVAELERATDFLVDGRQEAPQPVDVLLEVGRELEEQGAQLGAELERGGAEVAHRIVRVLEPGEVGDLLGG